MKTAIKDMPALLSFSADPILKSLRNWWLSRAERHYLICAESEMKAANEALMNVSHYQKLAALAKSARVQ